MVKQRIHDALAEIRRNRGMRKYGIAKSCCGSGEIGHCSCGAGCTCSCQSCSC